MSLWDAFVARASLAGLKIRTVQPGPREASRAPAKAPWSTCTLPPGQFGLAGEGPLHVLKIDAVVREAEGVALASEAEAVDLMQAGVTSSRALALLLPLALADFQRLAPTLQESARPMDVQFIIHTPEKGEMPCRGLLIQLGDGMAEPRRRQAELTFRHSVLEDVTVSIRADWATDSQMQQVLDNPRMQLPKMVKEIMGADLAPSRFRAIKEARAVSIQGKEVKAV